MFTLDQVNAFVFGSWNAYLMIATSGTIRKISDVGEERHEARVAGQARAPGRARRAAATGSGEPRGPRGTPGP